MAITVHTAYFTTKSVGGQFVNRMVEDEGVSNTDGSPTLEEYIELEAGDDFIESSRTDSYIVTLSASDLNAA